MKPAQECDRKGLAAPAAWVRKGKVHLFYQGNHDRGKTWYLSKVRIVWKDGLPTVKP